MTQLLSVQLIGTGDKIYESWKKRLESMAKKIQDQIKLEEVQKIEDILAFPIENIPALAIEGNVQIQNNDYDPSINDFEEFILEYIKKNDNMNTILVPTDFSANAKGAFKFANHLAEIYGANLKVIHVHNPASDGIIPNEIGSATLMESAKNEMLDRFVKSGTSDSMSDVVTELMIDKELIVGFAAEEIVRYSKEDEIDMIVMGTRGKSGAIEQLFGSVSTHVSQKAACPVWLIPDGYDFSKIDNIICASNYEMVDQEVIETIFQYAETLKSKIHFVHVEKENKSDPMGELVLEKLFRQKLPDQDFIFSSIEHQSVWEGVCQYASKKDANLIALVTKQRGFLDSLFHKSVTKQVILHAKCPILVLHI